MSDPKRAAIISLQLISSPLSCVSIVTPSFSASVREDDSGLSIVIRLKQLQTLGSIVGACAFLHVCGL